MTSLRPVRSALDYADIRALLPQRHPNLLVDQVVRCEPGTMIETLKAVSGGEPCYARLPGGLPADAYHYPEAQLLEDVICLVFLEHYFAEFAKGHDEEKVIGILRKTWRKMSDRGHEAALKLLNS